MCKKKKFTKLNAMIIIALYEGKRKNKYRNYKNLKRKEVRYYYCNECKAWHLTSKEGGYEKEERRKKR